MQFATRTTHDTPTRCRALNARSPRGALTLVELVIAITIILILISAVIVTGRMARDSRKKTQAQQSLATIANAINEYASFWPAWKIGTVKVADKGWPDFIAGRLFNAPFPLVVDFNDYVNLYSPPAGADNVLNANECLFYSLTAEVGKGPYLKPDISQDREYSLSPAGAARLYPGLSDGARPRQRILDPWGTPYRYFWVYRVPNPTLDPAVVAHRGYLPVLTADVTDPNFRTAIGYVLESAGPDKLYGNVWRVNPTTQEILEAEDNLIVSP